MWNADKYNPTATFGKDGLIFNDEIDGCVVYLLDFGGDNAYVGSTNNFKARISQHAESLRSEKHTPFVQKAFAESQVFNAYVLLNLGDVDKDTLHEAENSMIHLVRPKLNTNMPHKSSLSPNKTWRKAIAPPEPPKKKKPEFISLINTSTGPKTPYDIKWLFLYLEQDYHDEFITNVYEYFFNYTAFYPYLLDPEIKDKALELRILMEKSNIRLKAEHK